MMTRTRGGEEEVGDDERATLLPWIGSDSHFKNP